jgi:GDP-4-dehydro-6-deoxy-D-mannose reductase
MAANVNVSGSLSFFEACKEIKGLSILIIGSSTEYKYKNSEEYIYREDDILDSKTIYGSTKIAAELIGRAYVQNYQLDIKFTRSSNQSGPRQTTAYVLSNFAKQCADIAKNLQLPEINIGNIDIYRDFLDIEDTVEAYYAIMQRGKPGLVYNVSSKECYKIRDLLMQLITFTGCKNVVIKVDPSRLRCGEPEKVHCDTTLLYNDTGWQPKISISTTLKKIYKYWYEK